MTTAALAAQENALEASQMVHEDATAQAGPSESFDRTSQSQMLQRYLRELAEIEVEDAAREANKAPLAHPGVLERMPLAQHGRRDKRALREESNTAAIAEQPPKRRRVAERSTSGFNRQEGKAELRAPLQSISTATLNQSRKPPVPSGIIKGPGATSKEQPKPRAKNVISAPARPAPKVTDFTFQVVGQQQLSFQERLAAWQAREAEAAKLGKPMLQPLALPVKDSAKEARKADKHLVSKPKRPTQAKEFSWHSDKRAKERKDWEDRLREKEQILAELAEIRRLEAEAAEIEAVRKMRAAQIPIAHPVPAFIRSRSKRHA